ncbi:MAG TPA: cysteine desulfurase family protein [Acidimicrobiales bacterium]|nr:cysteine desulfurase family protein [Acidimicrobiales bacterium]
MVAYLDHAATSPLRPKALAAMEPYLTEQYGNPSSGHSLGRRARQAVDEARETVAACLGAQPGEVVFTGSGTEADNLAVSGARGDGVVVCTAVEHHAVLHPVESVGGRVVGVDGNGVIDLDALAAALDPSVTVVSVMLVNNEVGTIQPLEQVVEVVLAHAPNAVLHTDAVQAFPWVDVSHAARDASLISVSAHKFGGPKGVGALVVRDGTPVRAQILGGGQERDRRSGTTDVAGVVGMAAAMALTHTTRAATVGRVARLRDRLANELLKRVPGTAETGDRGGKVAGNCHLRFEGVESEALLVLLDDAGVCGSAGSACASGAIEPSHVLLAMGLTAAEAATSIRLSLGATTTAEDIDLALKAVPDAVAQLRNG